MDSFSVNAYLHDCPAILGVFTAGKAYHLGDNAALQYRSRSMIDPGDDNVDE
jgi:hypothetical protein